MVLKEFPFAAKKSAVLNDTGNCQVCITYETDGSYFDYNINCRCNEYI